jgi:phosphoenolpyruvate-protein kinase (PTS system EI component)
VFVYRGDGQVPVPEYLVERDRVDDELMRLKRAVVETKRDLETLISILRQRTGRSDVRVFECHLMILEDEILKKETKGYISETVSTPRPRCAGRPTARAASSSA